MAKANGAKAQGEEVLATAVALAKESWPDRLVASYALGSLAHGGFSAVSDVDLGLVLNDPLLPADGDCVARLTAHIKSSGKPFADRLSVFWGSLQSLRGTSTGGRFPPLDRLDLQRYGRLLSGRDVRSTLSPPTQEELVVAGAELAL